jgi:hypothetical protein
MRYGVSIRDYKSITETTEKEKRTKKRDCLHISPMRSITALRRRRSCALTSCIAFSGNLTTEGSAMNLENGSEKIRIGVLMHTAQF